MRTLYETAATKDAIGNDGLSRNAAHTGILPHGPGSARLQQTRMASDRKMTTCI